MGYTNEKCFKIWDDANGTHYEVCPDGDGLGLLELRYLDANENVVDRISFEKEVAQLICNALVELLEDAA